MSILDDTKKHMVAAIDHLKEELKGIRTGMANPSILDNITIEVYGSQMRIRDIATVSSPEPRQLLITPFDPQNTASIGKGIEVANIGIMPIVDGNVVRLNIPQMDENMRKDMVKMCHKKREDAKISVRNVRRDSNDTVKKQKNDGDIAEDEMKKLEKQIQDLTDKFCKEADEISAYKEKEVSTI